MIDLLTLSSIGDDGLGEELQVIWELEPGCRIIEMVALPESRISMVAETQHKRENTNA